LIISTFKLIPMDKTRWLEFYPTKSTTLQNLLRRFSIKFTELPSRIERDKSHLIFHSIKLLTLIT